MLIILFAIISQPDIWKSAGTSSAEVAAISNKQAKNSGGNEGDWTNPCGIVLFPDSLLLHQHPRHSHNYHLLLQLKMTLRRIQRWVDDFVSSNFLYFSFLICLLQQIRIVTLFIWCKQTIKKFHMTFEQKYAEDDGKYYSWLLVSSVVPNTTAVFLRHQNSIQTLGHTDHFKTISVRIYAYYMNWPKLQSPKMWLITKVLLMITGAQIPLPRIWYASKICHRMGTGCNREGYLFSRQI